MRDPVNTATALRITTSQAGESFAPRDFVVSAYQALWGSPFGISDLRAAYRPGILIEAAIKLRAILLENFRGR